MKPQMDLSKLMVDFDTEAECRAYLQELRWKDGVVCPRCEGKKISRVLKRDQFDCDSCRYQFSVMSGTVFHDSHLPLPKWFIATLLICESRKGMSANQMKRILGVSYKTAWYLCHRIRHAMKQVHETKMGGVIEMDETYVGGKVKGKGYKVARERKQIVIAIRQRGGDVRYFHVPNAETHTIRQLIEKHVSAHDCDIFITDEFRAYPSALKALEMKDKHATVNHSVGEYARGHIHTNTVESAFSLLERGIIGSWHRISAKHLAAYLQEMEFRFNNRKNPFLFRDTMLKLINTSNLEYKELTAA
jgi:transposase-like protein